MCMMFYIGTRNQLLEIAFDETFPGLHVRILSEKEQAIDAHFSTPNIAYIGSSSGCGCNFRHALWDHGNWLPVDGHGQSDNNEIKRNQQSLHDFLWLHKMTDRSVELFCCWNGEQNEPSLFRTEINIEEIIDEDFFFKERGFYSIKLEKNGPISEKG